MNTYHAASWSDPYSSSDEEEICRYNFIQLSSGFCMTITSWQNVMTVTALVITSLTVLPFPATRGQMESDKEQREHGRRQRDKDHRGRDEERKRQRHHYEFDKSMRCKEDTKWGKGYCQDRAKKDGQYHSSYSYDTCDKVVKEVREDIGGSRKDRVRNKVSDKVSKRGRLLFCGWFLFKEPLLLCNYSWKYNITSIVAWFESFGILWGFQPVVIPILKYFQVKVVLCCCDIFCFFTVQPYLTHFQLLVTLLVQPSLCFISCANRQCYTVAGKWRHVYFNITLLSTRWKIYKLKMIKGTVIIHCVKNSENCSTCALHIITHIHTNSHV